MHLGPIASERSLGFQMHPGTSCGDSGLGTDKRGAPRTPTDSYPRIPRGPPRQDPVRRQTPRGGTRSPRTPPLRAAGCSSVRSFTTPGALRRHPSKSSPQPDKSFQLTRLDEWGACNVGRAWARGPIVLYAAVARPTGERAEARGSPRTRGGPSPAGDGATSGPAWDRTPRPHDVFDARATGKAIRGAGLNAVPRHGDGPPGITMAPPFAPVSSLQATAIRVRLPVQVSRSSDRPCSPASGEARRASPRWSCARSTPLVTFAGPPPCVLRPKR